eukprot:TRINITY_DN9196_c0_g1_i1.p1 TRINITY_DN9196_c0_g1~~TRINITY_DN9196_c0_g1_i1.p1  ORF type:complete len:450 (+),score=75.60 TRINITY_DN9196_c0_g1_i1:23-1351(+)
MNTPGNDPKNVQARPHVLSRQPSVFLGSSYYQSYGGDDQGPVVRITNVKILRNHKIIEEDLWIQHGRIIDPQMRFMKLKKSADITVDGKGSIISPGYIDIQLNGAFGVDFSTPSDIKNGAIKKVAKELLQHGVTSFCPTLITSDPATYREILPQIVPTRGSTEGAEVIGVHLEGPFLSESKYGAHRKEFIQNEVRGISHIEDIYGSLDHVSILTMAPELKGVIDVIPELTKRGVIISAGHSMATIDQAEAAVDKGVTLITHLFNAMVPFHHRDPGLVGLLGTNTRQIFFSMIVDGVHSHPSCVKIAYKAFPQGFVLITDAIGAMGLPEGSSVQLGTMKVDIRGGKAYISGKDTLAGSIVTMEAAVRNFKASTGCSTVEALEAATLHPAETLGITQFKGTLDYGSDADFVLLDNDLNLRATFVDGQLAFSQPGFLNTQQFKTK